MTRGALIAGVPGWYDPLRLFRLLVVIVVTAFSLVSMMFLIMVRVRDPLLPRAAVDPFTYSVHAFKCVILKNTGFGAIAYDLAFLLIFSVVSMTAATLLFKGTL